MTKEIQAIYERRIIRPVEPLELPEGTRLDVIVITREKPRPNGNAAVMTSGTHHRIPFEISNNLVILQGSINGSQPLAFILDTGASTTVISDIRAKELGLKLEGRTDAATQGGSIEASFVMVSLIPVTHLRELTASSIKVPDKSRSNQLNSHISLVAS